MKRSNWIEVLVLPPAVAVLNTAWVWLWVLWLVRAVPPEVVARPFSPLLLGLLVLGGYAVTRWAWSNAEPNCAAVAPVSKMSEVNARLVITLAGLVLVFAAVWQTYAFIGPFGMLHELVDWGNFISPVFLGLAACAFLWFQGIQLGRSSLPQENLERAFYGGIVALSALFAVNQLRPLIATGDGLTAALAFFATGLAGLALVSVEHARRAEEGSTSSWPALNRYWLGTVASVIGSILLAGLLLASVLSPQTFERVANALNLLVDDVTIGVIIVTGVMVYVMASLLAPIIEYLARSVAGIHLNLPAFLSLFQTSKQTLNFFAQHPTLNIARRGFVLAAILAAMVLLFWWAVRHYKGRARRDDDETRENIATRALLWAQLRNLLKRRQRAGAAPPPYLALSGATDDPRLIVRRAYQAMLEWAPVLSLPTRRAGQTPAAYAETLRQALPEGGLAIETLTGAYVQARYAAEAPSMDVAQAATGAIKQLRSLSARLNRPSSNA